MFYFCKEESLMDELNELEIEDVSKEALEELSDNEGGEVGVG